MYLRDLAIYADDNIVETYRGGFVSKFHRDTCCVVELYLLLIRRKVVTPDTVKVSFEFTNDEVRLANTKKYGAALGCMERVCPFDFAAYVAAEIPQKKRLILDALQAGLLQIAAERNWPTAELESAYALAIERSFVLEAFGKKTWVSPDKKFKIRVWFQFDLDWVELYAVLFRNGSNVELARKHLGHGLPESGCLYDYLANGQWLSSTRFCLQETSFLRRIWEADFADIMQ